MGEMSLDEFVTHKGTGYGKGSFLKKWKKREPPYIDTWLHTRATIGSVWMHGQPRIVEREDRDTGRKIQEVWFGQWPCWEDDAIVEVQYKRDNESGLRIKPPTICPVCLLAEWVRGQVDTGELDWTKVIFRYDARDAERPLIVHAGGIYGAFGRKNPPFSEQEIKQLRKAEIDRSKVWGENQMAKLFYVFRVVDNDNPGDGCCITTEPNLLGDKVKEVIHKRKMDVEDEGDPLKYPYCIRWLYKPQEKEFNKKYDANAMSKIKLTPEIRKLIVDDDPPDARPVMTRRNPIMLRALMEESCLIRDQVPWDAIFGRACKAWEAQESKSTSFNTDELEGDAPKPRAAGKADDWVCEDCGELIKAGVAKCHGCGAMRPHARLPADSDGPGADDDDRMPY